VLEHKMHVCTLPLACIRYKTSYPGSQSRVTTPASYSEAMLSNSVPKTKCPSSLFPYAFLPGKFSDAVPN
jgi:hypothetical protein